MDRRLFIAGTSKPVARLTLAPRWAAPLPLVHERNQDQSRDEAADVSEIGDAAAA